MSFDMMGPGGMSTGDGAMIPPIPKDTTNLPHDSRGGVVVGTAVLSVIVAGTAVGLRLYTRAVLVRKIGLDDYMAITSMAFLLALGVGQCFNVASGLGRHIYDLNLPDDFIPYFRDFWICLLLYNIALLFIKMTFLFQYYRVVAQVQKLKIIYIVAMVLVGGWTLSQVILIGFLCLPIQGLWDPSVKAMCLDAKAENDLNAIGNIVTDFIVLLLPLPVLLRLNLRPAQKWALIGVFCLGFFTCIVSIIRRVTGLMFTQDVTYSSVDVNAWSIAEVASGITCAALPTLKPLLSRYFPSLKSKIQRLSDYHKNSQYRSTWNSRATRSLYTSREDKPRPMTGRSSRHASISKPQLKHTSIEPWTDSSQLEMGARPSDEEPKAPWGPLTSHQTQLPPMPPPKDAHYRSPSITSSHRSITSSHSRNASADNRLTQWPSGGNGGLSPNGSSTTLIVGGREAASRPNSAVGDAIRVKRDVRIESQHGLSPPPPPPPGPFS
ncbi:hypothetical protein F4780DRAFT_173677 [Xylariomycetidae sp. FL0641]|nr:hypothetical protein F4780DRAFT_173677 [Xylariomycetidae sp. FL0641]